MVDKPEERQQGYRAPAHRLGSAPALLCLTLLAAWLVGTCGRGFYTPDEPREADIAWRMSWQADKAVPVLAGEAFCEKPPLTYWLAALPIALLGAHGWAARLPNVLYAVIAALSVGLLARRAVGPIAGLAAAGAMGTLLLAYQTEIWLATDAPLLAFVSAALLGAYRGFYARDRGERLGGYLLMHLALALGFLSKSAAAWMVPVLTLLALIVWERRWRELLRWELYAGLVVEAALILTWVWFVYTGNEGPAHLRIFFWNNLIGRFTQVDAPAELQYAAAHRNIPGKYLIELPLYLAPWTLLVGAAARRAWMRSRSAPTPRAVRFALACSIPSLLLLSAAATARNVYFAPVLPGIALLLAWWIDEARESPEAFDVRALKATAVLLQLAVLLFGAALAVAGAYAWGSMHDRVIYVLVSAAGLAAAAVLAARAWRLAGSRPLGAHWALFLAYGVLLVAPLSQLYARADAWQDLGAIGTAIRADTAGHPIVLLAPDETTRAMIDLYTRTEVGWVPPPLNTTALQRLGQRLHSAPNSLVVAQDRGNGKGPDPPWLGAARLHVVKRYALPFGRRYLLIAPGA
ncbi:MAG TPA: glycosyltransferase family 39 protein [Steroidobacteraceae bacterium]|jgi:4-amino-4-deoxy-L-arabinose transferase-like glycosyltransferase|nr:glycosyltransferase family 39 protein [Steroidobacteraceae bacterium]